MMKTHLALLRIDALNFERELGGNNPRYACFDCCELYQGKDMFFSALCPASDPLLQRKPIRQEIKKYSPDRMNQHLKRRLEERKGLR